MVAESQTASNQLWLARTRAQLPQKVVATLLGHRTNDQLSRYERGVCTPGLKVALMLELIYGVPLRVLFQAQYEQARQQVVELLKLCQKAGYQIEGRLSQIEVVADFCTYLDLLNMPNISRTELESVDQHLEDMRKKLAYL